MCCAREAGESSEMHLTTDGHESSCTKTGSVAEASSCRIRQPIGFERVRTRIYQTAAHCPGRGPEKQGHGVLDWTAAAGSTASKTCKRTRHASPPFRSTISQKRTLDKFKHSIPLRDNGRLFDQQLQWPDVPNLMWPCTEGLLPLQRVAFCPGALSREAGAASG